MKDLVARLDDMADGWLCRGLPDAELPREAAREIERLREHAVILANTAEAVEREQWQKQCAGKRHEGCNYVATCGSLCNKCGQWAT